MKRMTYREKENIKNLVNEIYDILEVDSEMLEDFEGDYIKVDVNDMKSILSLLSMIDLEL